MSSGELYFYYCCVIIGFVLTLIRIVNIIRIRRLLRKNKKKIP